MKKKDYDIFQEVKPFILEEDLPKIKHESLELMTIPKESKYTGQSNCDEIYYGIDKKEVVEVYTIYGTSDTRYKVIPEYTRTKEFLKTIPQYKAYSEAIITAKEKIDKAKSVKEGVFKYLWIDSESQTDITLEKTIVTNLQFSQKGSILVEQETQIKSDNTEVNNIEVSVQTSFVPKIIYGDYEDKEVLTNVSTGLMIEKQKRIEELKKILSTLQLDLQQDIDIHQQNAFGELIKVVEASNHEPHEPQILGSNVNHEFEQD